MTDRLADRYPSVEWGESEWFAALQADNDLYFRILRGIGKAVEREQRRHALTGIEVSCLEAASRGDSVSQIGKHYYASEDAVKSALTRARRKLGARNTTHAVVLAISRGLIPIPEV